MYKYMYHGGQEMSFDRLRYELQLMGKRVILTPMLVMFGFGVFAELLHYLNVNPGRFLSSGLEMFLPMAAGVIVATIVSHDPAIELQLTLPKKYSTAAMLRLVLIVCWTACIAVLSGIVIDAFQLGYTPQQLQSWAIPFQFFVEQLMWIAPLLWFVAVGFCLALLIRSRSASGAILGGIWLAEIVFKDFIAITPWLRPILLFPTTLILFPSQNIPQFLFNIWLTNRFEVLGTGLALLPLGWLLLHNTEGLLKGSSEE